MRLCVWMIAAFTLSLSNFLVLAAEPTHVVYEGSGGIGAGKHIVFIAFEHEYRGEESLPALARILAKHYGFKCTVIFGTDPKTGFLLPGSSDLHGLSVLKEADLIVIFMRFINMPDDEMQQRQLVDTIGAPLNMLQDLRKDWSWEIVPRVHDFQAGIETLRKRFPEAWFDEAGCKEGLDHLALYRKKFKT